MIGKLPLSLSCALLLILFLFVQPLFAQINLQARLPIDSNIKIGKLANGLTYYIRKNQKPEKKVQLRLVVNAGSVLEDKDQQGLAHMMEHMNFNGSTHFPKNELVNYLQSIGVQFGADLNASTGFDETVYILPIPSDDQDKVDKGFTILEDWAGNALLDTTEINKERGVVLEESRLGKGAGERMQNKYFPKLMNGSKYAERLPIGKDDTIKYFKYKTLRRFYHDWYRPDLQAVIVVGDIDPAIAEQEIVKHFSHFKNPANERKRPVVIPIGKRIVSEGMVLTDKEETNTILLIYNYIEREKPDSTWADYRSSIIEGLFSSIINQRLSELTEQPDPPFIFGNTGFGPFLRGYRTFNSIAVLGDKPVKSAVDALITTTEAVRKYGFLQSELDRAKSSLLNQTERSFKDKGKTESSRFVQSYINNFLSGDPIPGIENRYAFVQQVLPTITLVELNGVAAKMQNAQGKFALITAPQKDIAKLPGDKELLDMVASAHKLPVKAYEEKAVASILINTAPTPGKVVSESSDPVLNTIDLTLSNGITVTLRPTDFKNDEIRMDSWRWGGFMGYGLGKKLTAENAASIVDQMGVKDMSSIDLRKYLAGKTVNATPYINAYDEGIEGSSSVKDLETFFQLLYLYFTEPRKDEKIFQSYITTQKSFLKNLADNPNAYFADTLSKVEYNNSPWAEAFPKSSEYDNINLEDVMSIYKSVFGNAYGWHFTFVGNIDTAKLKTMLETYVASLPTTPKENKFTDVGLRPVKGIVNLAVKKGAAKKSLVNIIFNGELPYSKEDELKLTALTDLLNIKIIEQLREDMSGIYGGGMHGTLAKRPYNNYSVTLNFPCGPENVDKLVNAASAIIKNAQEKGVEQKDLDKVKETLKKQNEDQMKDNEHWLDELSYSWIEQNDPKWILDYSKSVDALTVQDVQDAAKKYLNMQNYIKAVLYPEK
jgi:zinc protease